MRSATRYFLSLLVIPLLFAFASAPALSEDRPTPMSKTDIQARAATAQPTPATAAGATDLAAPPAVAASAACCLKQCAGGGNCGQNCTVADSLSQCGAVNFKFECGANQGLSCQGYDCSCN